MSQISLTVNVSPNYSPFPFIWLLLNCHSYSISVSFNLRARHDESYLVFSPLETRPNNPGLLGAPRDFLVQGKEGTFWEIRLWQLVGDIGRRSEGINLSLKDEIIIFPSINLAQLKLRWVKFPSLRSLKTHHRVATPLISPLLLRSSPGSMGPLLLIHTPYYISGSKPVDPST